MDILVTGALGWTAVAILETLAEAGHTVTGFDLPGAAPPDGARPRLARLLLGDIAHFGEVDPACKGADAIIHLAVAIGKDDYKNAKIPFNTNVRGTYNVFEAARKNKISKIVMLGSAPVHMQPYPEKDCAASPGGDHLYDLTKCLQETIARNYWETFGMHAVVLRAGHIVDGRAGLDPHKRPLASLQYCRGGWVCRYDLARAAAAATHPKITGYLPLSAVGARPGRAHFDTARTESILGMVFEEDFAALENGAPET